MIAEKKIKIPTVAREKCLGASPNSAGVTKANALVLKRNFPGCHPGIDSYEIEESIRIAIGSRRMLMSYT